MWCFAKTMNYSIDVSWHNVDCYYKNLPVKQVVLTGKNEQDCFVQFFKKNNGWKYCNGCYYEFNNAATAQRYNKWLTVENYAIHGGCMD